MTQIFNNLIDSFILNKVGIADHFLSESLANHLKENLIKLFNEKKFKPAGIGNNEGFNNNQLVRSDVMYWLDRNHNDIHENNFFDLMDEFILYLNSSCYAGITSCEFHYTRYETGSFYKKHVDQFRDNDSRKYSMIMYLNAEWKQKDGGELCIHHDNHQQKISPVQGKSVFFNSSEMEHEVLITNKPRLSITGWLKG